LTNNKENFSDEMEQEIPKRQNTAYKSECDNNNRRNNNNNRRRRDLNDDQSSNGDDDDTDSESDDSDDNGDKIVTNKLFQLNKKKLNQIDNKKKIDRL